MHARKQLAHSKKGYLLKKAVSILPLLPSLLLEHGQVSPVTGKCHQRQQQHSDHQTRYPYCSHIQQLLAARRSRQSIFARICNIEADWGAQPSVAAKPIGAFCTSHPSFSGWTVESCKHNRNRQVICRDSIPRNRARRSYPLCTGMNSCSMRSVCQDIAACSVDKLRRRSAKYSSGRSLRASHSSNRRAELFWMQSNLPPKRMKQTHARYHTLCVPG